MAEPAACPICTMKDLLECEDLFECAICGHEWTRDDGSSNETVRSEKEHIVLDVNGAHLIS